MSLNATGDPTVLVNGNRLQREEHFYLNRIIKEDEGILRNYQNTETRNEKAQNHRTHLAGRRDPALQ
jgi:hypothetical protein